MNDFYKIGQVIEVRGQKLRIRVFENKNSNILIYQGHVIKNVSVGSFVKITKGFSNIIVIAGSDRIAEYQKAEKYALENGATTYKVMSAGERDPDADGAEGMSASKMRKAAADGDFESFKLGSGHATDIMSHNLYTAVRKGMGIK